jgi:protein phosphatase
MVVAVADGMGGHVAGEVASSLALESAMSESGSAGDRVRAGNESVVEAIIADPTLAGMGTTLTLISFGADGEIDLAHIGDSRAYRLRGRKLEQLTHDHTLVADLVAEGRLDPGAVEGHPQRNLLTRVIGMGKSIAVDEIADTALPGDRLLLCSDGLTNMLTEAQIVKLLRSGDAEEAVWALIEAANDAGGEDNITVVVVVVAA